VGLISTDLQDGVLILRFSDPSSSNSLSLAAAEELARILTRISEGVDKNETSAPYRALVFFSKGRIFCSGGQLSDYASMSNADQGKAVNRRITEILANLSELPIPTICAVSGDCFGGGVELISAFDTVISVPHVLYGFWQRRIGLTFGWGGGKRIEQRIGLPQLKRLALSTETFGAHEALSIGLIDFIVPVSSLESVSLEIAEQMSTAATAPIGQLKKWSADRETEIFESLWWNPDHRAVLSKRNPKP
jgi:enoyl-CoA hydratase/carnithine racemase